MPNQPKRKTDEGHDEMQPLMHDESWHEVPRQPLASVRLLAALPESGMTACGPAHYGFTQKYDFHRSRDVPMSKNTGLMPCAPVYAWTASFTPFSGGQPNAVVS